MTGWTSWQTTSLSTATTRWETGKSMLVCIDKITCARMLRRIEPRWSGKLANVRPQLPIKEAELADRDGRRYAGTPRQGARLLTRQAEWMESTIIEIVISEAQNEVRDFQKWDFDIIPHRVVMKTGFETPDGKRVQVDDAFKDPAASVPHRHCLRHVAHRLRRGVPGNALHRQADEGSQPHAGHRPRQPRLSRQRLRRHR